MQTEARWEIGGIQAVDVLAMTFDVRQLDIENIHHVPDISIDVAVEGELCWTDRQAILVATVPAALGVKVQLVNIEKSGFILSLSADDDEAASLIASDDGNCVAVNGLLTARNATGSQISRSLSASGPSPVQWSGKDNRRFTFAIALDSDQKTTVERVAAQCGFVVQSKEISLRGLRVQRRPSLLEKNGELP